MSIPHKPDVFAQPKCAFSYGKMSHFPKKKNPREIIDVFASFVVFVGYFYLNPNFWLFLRSYLEIRRFL